jgi:hypothetical protein
MSGFSFNPTWIRTLPAKLAGVCGAFAALGLMVVAPTSSSHAQALDTFAILAGQTVTNTGTTFINGNLGVWPGTAVTGFGGPFPSNGTVTAPYTIYAGNAVAQRAQGFLTAAFLSLQGRPITAVGPADLGGQTLGPGVYSFATSAQLTGPLSLTLNGAGVYIFNIGSTLTSSGVTPNIVLQNGARGGNVFFVVGSSATLGTGTSFQGNILALTSISLDTAATINCGAALARNGSVTLDTNTITICSNSLLANAFTQSSGEVGTGAALAGFQAMNSFLSLVTNPFENNRPFAPAETSPSMPVKAPIKALGYGPESPQSPAFASVDRAPFAGGRRWGIWGAAYGGQNNTAGNLLAGTHDSSARTFGFATGLDYLATPYTVVGFALGGGGTNYGVSDGLGSGRSDMFQAAVYSMTRVNAAYVSAALAYAWHRVSTERDVTLVGTDHLTADFSANSFGGRIEGGYRFAIPGVFDSSGFGLTPYAALQAQSFHTPSYSETVASGSPLFALAYNAHTTTAVRTELGSWVDKSYTLDRNNVLSLFGRAAWAHDHYSDPSLTAAFESALPGSSFIVNGATPVTDSALLTAGAQLYMRNGWAVMAKLDTEFAQGSHTYMGTARLRYTW